MDAELVLVNGNIATMDADERFVDALAARSGRVVALGGPQVQRWLGPNTEVTDLDGRTAIPGIIDSHCHADGRAARLASWHDLSPATVHSRDELLEHIESACRILAPGAWFAGYRLNERDSGGYPTMEELDRAGLGRPVFVLRTDGHLGLANHAAFERCGITASSPDPDFGRFDRNPHSGAFTGLVRETAAHIFLETIHGDDTPETIAEGLQAVFGDYLSYGVTTIYNSLVGSIGMQAYQLCREQGRLGLRVGFIVSGREPGLVESYVRSGIRSGFGDEWLRIIGVEWCPDCSTSGRTAAYYEPYGGQVVEGEPANNRGMLLYDAEDLAKRVSAAHAAGLLVMIEGVGDRGIDFALDAIEAALGARPTKDHRMRVEHCCFVTPKIQERLLRLGVIDSSATGFMYELGDAYIDNRGVTAMRYMWPHRTLIDRGIPAPGHSDAWVCTPNPFTAMWSMVNRRTRSGRSLDSTEAITPTEALRAYTSLGAFSGREEHDKGALELGKLADVAVLDRDLFTIDPDDIRNIEVALTVVGGEVRYRKQC